MEPNNNRDYHLDRPENGLGFTCWQLTNLWQKKTLTALKKLELTHVQFVLMAGIHWLTQQALVVSQKRLAEHAKTDIMMTSKVLRTLEKKGMVIRARLKSDTRARSLLLTNKGKDTLADAKHVMHELDQQFFSNFANCPQELRRNLQQLLLENIEAAIVAE